MSILTYLWTCYLANQVIILIPTVKISIGIHFYIYLSSSIFLIISLFINNKKEISEKEESSYQQVANNPDNNTFNEDNFIFTNFLMGVKEIPLNTKILLVNNIPDRTLDLIYTVNSNEKASKTIKLPIDTIKNISFDAKIRMQNINKKVEETETESILLSTVVFGGSPLLRLAGNNGFNALFSSLSNNYNKVNYNTYYEITINTLINNQEVKLLFTAEKNPEEFTQRILNK